MPHEFDLDGAGGYTPDGKPKSNAYNPADYGLPIWRDEDHLPPEETKAEEVTAEPVTCSAGGMTAEAARQKFLIWAQEQIGYHEGSNNQNKYADTPWLQQMYGWYPQNQPWCDVFYDAGMIECFGVDAACAMTYQPMGAGSALCKQSAQYYKDHGAWFNSPEIGDQIFFYASGDINHTGVVIRVSGGSVITVEGNSSDQVAERVYSISDTSRIAGYGRPNWAAASGTDIDTPVSVPTLSADPSAPVQRTFDLRFPYLRRGSIGAFVIAVQFQLMGQGYSVGPDGADGDYGGNTEEAVKEYQLNVHLEPDGIVGPKTSACLFGGTVVEQEQPVTPEEQSEGKEEPKANSFLNGLLAKIKNR